MGFEEWIEFNDLENERELDQFREALETHNLEELLSPADLEQLYKLWRFARDVEFSIEAGNSINKLPQDPSDSSVSHNRNLHEQSTRRLEKHYMEEKERFYMTPSWQSLPADIRENLEDSLFQIQIADS